MFRATTACNFSSLISPDVFAPAAYLASLFFNPPEPQNQEKLQCFAFFLSFRAPASSFFWSFLFWLFSLLTAFSSLDIVGSLTSKFLSITILLYCIILLYYIILYCIILYYIMILLYYNIIILLYYDIMILLYYNIIILLYYYIIVLWYYYIIIFLYYYIIISLYHFNIIIS